MNKKIYFVGLTLLSGSLLLQFGCATKRPELTKYYDYNEYKNYENIKIKSSIKLTGKVSDDALKITMDSKLNYPDSDQYMVEESLQAYSLGRDIGELICTPLILPFIPLSLVFGNVDFVLFGLCYIAPGKNGVYTNDPSANLVVTTNVTPKKSFGNIPVITRKHDELPYSLDDIKITFSINGENKKPISVKKHSRWNIDLKKTIESCLKTGKEKLVVLATADYPDGVSGTKLLMNRTVDLKSERHRCKRLKDEITASQSLQVYTGSDCNSLSLAGKTPYVTKLEGLDKVLPHRWVKVVDSASGAKGVFEQKASAADRSVNFLVKHVSVAFSCANPNAILRIGEKKEEMKVVNLPYVYSGVVFQNTTTKEPFSNLLTAQVAVDGAYLETQVDILTTNTRTFDSSEITSRPDECDPFILYELGIACCNTEDGVTPNIEQAERFLKRAAGQGHVDAKNKLARMRIEKMRPQIKNLIRRCKGYARRFGEFEFKGLYLGMDVQEAKDILNYYNNDVVTFDGYYPDAGITSDAAGRVTYIGLSQSLVHKIFDLRNVKVVDFVQSFINVTSIPEMKGTRDTRYSDSYWEYRDVLRGFSLEIHKNFIIRLSRIKKSSEMNLY